MGGKGREAKVVEAVVEVAQVVVVAVVVEVAVVVVVVVVEVETAAVARQASSPPCPARRSPSG